ncbi:MAG: putative DNA-binding protein [Clostridia bacterium]|nr:putative DNA-binding protein [Clostridia bacterium]
MKSDTYRMSMLFDFYGELLTEKQKELFDLYYNEDLSLSEIAEHVGITRQGVRDAIMRAEEVLRDTEDKLKLMKRYGSIEKQIEKIAEAASYIARVNATVRNYEIATRTEQILGIVRELSQSV